MTAVRPPGTGRRRLALAAVSVLGALAALEGACRYEAHRRNQGAMDVAFSAERVLEQGGRVALIDILRASDHEDVVFELKPGLSGVPFKGVPLSTDRHGFRGPERTVAPGPDTVTVLGLGDSVMFGHGVGDGLPYLDVLEKGLRRRHPQRAWRVINTAVPAYNTVQELATLRAKGLAHQPDLVILGLVGNDLVLPRYVRVVEDVFDLSRSFLWEQLSARLGDDGLERHGFALNEGRDPRLVHHQAVSTSREVPEAYRHLVGWEPFTAALEELDRLSDEHGFEVLVVTVIEHGAEQMLEYISRYDWPLVRMRPVIQRELGAGGEVATGPVDLDAYLRSDLVVNASDAHPSARLHFLIAQELLRALEQNGLIEALSR